MRKFLLIFCFLGLIFLAVGNAKGAEAATHTDYMEVTYSNTAGTIPITVYYYFVKAQLINGVETGVNTTFGSGSVGLSTGGSYGPTVVSSILHDPGTEGGANYYMHWATNCEDPPVKWSGFELSAGGNFKYSFTSQDVSCKTTNGEPVVSSIACPSPGTALTFSWQMTGGGPYNVDHYNLFRDSGPTDPYPNNTYIQTVPASQTSISWSGLSPGTNYWVGVQAVSPQNGYSLRARSSTVCQSQNNPPEGWLDAADCTSFRGWARDPDNLGAAIRVDFYAGGPAGSWSFVGSTTANLPGEPAVGDHRFSFATPASLKDGQNYSIYAYGIDSQGGTNSLLSGSPKMFNVNNCVPPPPTNLTVTLPSVSCTGTTYSATFNWMLSAGTTKVDFELMNRDNGGFITSSYWLSAVTSTSYSPLSPGINYYFRVKAGSDAGYSSWVSSSPFSLPACPNLVISWPIILNKSVYTPNETGTATVDVVNEGGGAAGSFMIELFPANVLGGGNPSYVLDTTCAQTSASTATVSSLAAFSRTSVTISFTAPPWVGTFRAYAHVDGTCQVAESDETDNLSSSLDYTVRLAPTNPANLTVSQTCDATNKPQVTFSWTDSLYETGYYLDVTTGSGWTQWGVKTLGVNATSFVWSINSQLDSGTPLTPTEVTTYWWRLKAFNDVFQSSHVYPGGTDGPDGGTVPDGTLTPPGNSFTTPDCPKFDLSASFVGGSMRKTDGTPTQNFKAGETITVDLRVANSQLANASSPATGVGVWPNKTNTTDLPNCSIPTPATPPAGTTFSTGYFAGGPSGNVGVVSPNTSYPDITVSFAASTIPGSYTVYAYVIPSCSPTDYKWDNNGSNTGSTTLNGVPVDNVSITYTVTVDAWFETTGGDVGSAGTGNPSISVSQAPPTTPAARYQTDYLVAGLNLDSKVVSKRWRINNYAKPLVAASPYAYLAERFLEKAKATNPQGDRCLLGSTPTSIQAGFNYCKNTTTLHYAIKTPPSGQAVWFIDGDLNSLGAADVIAQSPSDSLVIIASGDINLNISVKRIDAVLIAGGTITTSYGGSVSDNQLVVNGAVYGKNVSINRKLSSSGTCTYDSATKTIVAAFSCSNTTDPAEIIKYDPKYLVALNDLLGSPGVSWKEVAP